MIDNDMLLKSCSDSEYDYVYDTDEKVLISFSSKKLKRSNSHDKLKNKKLNQFVSENPCYFSRMIYNCYIGLIGTHQ